MWDFNRVGMDTKTQTPKSLFRVPGKAEIAISIVLKWVCDQHFQWVGGQLSVEIIESKQPLNGMPDFNKSSMPIQNYRDCSRTIACFFPLSPSPSLQDECANIGIVLYRCLRVVWDRREMTFWHSLNGKCVGHWKREMWLTPFPSD